MRAVILAATATFALLAMTAQASACTQEAADRLAERTDDEVARDILRSYPVVGLYALTSVENEIYVFSLVRPLANHAPETFRSEAVLFVSCTFGINDWWHQTRDVGVRVLVAGDISEPSGFAPGLLYDPGSAEALLLENKLNGLSESAE